VSTWFSAILLSDQVIYVQFQVIIHIVFHLFKADLFCTFYVGGYS
jgi:hypothetical protein